VLAAQGTREEREKASGVPLASLNLCAKCGAQMVNNYRVVFVGREPRFFE